MHWLLDGWKCVPLLAPSFSFLDALPRFSSIPHFNCALDFYERLILSVEKCVWTPTPLYSANQSHRFISSTTSSSFIPPSDFHSLSTLSRFRLIIDKHRIHPSDLGHNLSTAALIDRLIRRGALGRMCFVNHSLICRVDVRASMQSVITGPLELVLSLLMDDLKLDLPFPPPCLACVYFSTVQDLAIALNALSLSIEQRILFYQIITKP